VVSPELSPIAGPLEEFARSVGEAYSSTLPGDPEDQLKPPVGAFLRAVGASLGYDGVLTSLEARVEGIGRPDLAVASGRLLVGHVELKQPGKGVIPSRFTGHDKRQWGKFKLLPNLIYTDGESWALYREGEREGPVVRLSGDPASDGKGAVGAEDAGKLERLFRGFLSWRPIVPASPRALAEVLAPLCHLLREDVMEALSDPESNLSSLAGTWREYLFPDADVHQFADAYAQTITYALLLARFSPGAAEANLDGSGTLETGAAVDILRPNNELLSRTLRLLAVEEAREEISLGMGLLERAIGAVDPSKVAREDDNPWLYFYEDFLAAYDPKLRKERGVYYTPAEVVGCQVRLISEILEEKFGKELSFADDGVVTLDPACGTGTYPLAALQHGLNKVRKRYGDAGARATHMAQNLHAFEILVGPYTVAHLKVSKEILDAGGSLPDGGIGVYLTDTLDSPHAEPPDRFDLFAQELGKEHQRALEIKRHVPVLVCLGNPPYGRHGANAPNGGWVRYADLGDGFAERSGYAPWQAERRHRGI
jgi:N-6 DNA Methylase